MGKEDVFYELFGEKKFEEALECCEEMIKELGEPQVAKNAEDLLPWMKVHARKAAALEELGRHEDALAEHAAYRKLAEPFAGNRDYWVRHHLANAYFSVAKVLHNYSQIEKALELYIETETILYDANMRADLHDLMGEIYEQLGQYEKAVEMYEEAIRIFDGLNVTYLWTGDNDVWGNEISAMRWKRYNCLEKQRLEKARRVE